jgi:hypothetical protein
MLENNQISKQTKNNRKVAGTFKEKVQFSVAYTLNSVMKTAFSEGSLYARVLNSSLSEGHIPKKNAPRATV